MTFFTFLREKADYQAVYTAATTKKKRNCSITQQKKKKKKDGTERQ